MRNQSGISIRGAVANRYLSWCGCTSQILRNHCSNLLTDQILIELTTPTVIYRFRKSFLQPKLIDPHSIKPVLLSIFPKVIAQFLAKLSLLAANAMQMIVFDNNLIDYSVTNFCH